VATPDLRLIAFLTLALGFLTLSASAAPLDDAIRTLDLLESARTGILREADSLGQILSDLPSLEDPRARDLFRRAEDLGRRSSEVEVEILLARGRCRTLAIQEMEGLEIGPGSRQEDVLARGSEILRLLEGRLGDPWRGEVVMVEPDTLDGYETLLDKEAYLQDIQDRLLDLDRQIERRIASVGRERALRVETERLADEARFLDEGGRVGSDDAALLPGGGGSTGGSGDLKPWTMREGVLGDGDASSLLRTPIEIGGEGDPVELLRAARSQLAQDLSLVSASLRRTRDLQERFESRPRP